MGIGSTEGGGERETEREREKVNITNKEQISECRINGKISKLQFSNKHGHSFDKSSSNAVEDRLFSIFCWQLKCKFSTTRYQELDVLPKDSL